MLDLLTYMFHRGNVIDIAWFLGGAWLLLLFLVLMIRKIVQSLRRKTRRVKSD